MQLHLTPFRVAATLAVLGTLVGATAVAQNQGAGGLKVAVVDIGELFKAYKRKDAFEKDVNERREQIKNELDEEQKHLIELRQEIPQYREGTPPWYRAREKLELANFVADQKAKRLQSELKGMVEEQTLQILTELETTIASYGKRAGYDLILKVDSGGGPTEGGGELVEHFQERIFRAQISDVLFFKDTLDVTKRVLDYLNSKGNLAKMERQAAERKRGRRGGKPQPQGADKPK